MKHFRGVANGIGRPMVCRIDSPWVDRNDDFVASCTLPSRDSSLAQPVLLSTAINPHSAPTPNFQVARGYELPRPGDIVLLEPQGKGTILYEIASNDNAVFLTGECNGNCVMCPQPPSNGHDSYGEMILDVIELMHPETKMLGITGGEPTLKWLELIRILNQCQKSIPSATLQILTNGRELKDFSRVKELSTASDNDCFFSIPLYGDTDALHDFHMGLPGSFWETLDGLYNLARIEAPVELRVLITKVNYSRLVEIAEFIYRALPFVEQVALMGLEPVGRAKENIHSLWVDAEQYSSQLVDAVRYFTRRGVGVSIFNHPLCVVPKPVRHFARISISSWKRHYFDTCSTCACQEQCGGVFASAKDHFKEKVEAI